MKRAKCLSRRPMRAGLMCGTREIVSQYAVSLSAYR